MYYPRKRKFRIPLPLLTGISVAAAVYAIGLAMSNQIVYEEIQQLAFATAQCGDVASNLRFSSDSRVSLFVREHLPKVLFAASIAGGLVAAIFVRDRRPAQPNPLSDTEAAVLIETVASSGIPVAQVIDIISQIKTTS